MGELVWDWHVALYLWLASLGAGIYLVAFLADLISSDGEDKLLRQTIPLSVPCFVAALAALLLQAKNLEPIGTMLLALLPGSGFSMAAWTLGCTIVVALPLMLQNVAEARNWPVMPGEALLRRLLLWLYTVGCFAVILATGWLLMDTSRVLWASSYLLAELFVTSAALCGVAGVLVLFRSQGTDVTSPTVRALQGLQPILLVIQLLLLVAFVAYLGLQPSMVAAILPLFGPTLPGIVLWAGGVFAGLVLPLLIELWLGPARSWDLYPSRLLVASPLLVIAGAFAVRLAFLTAGQA